MPVWRATRMDFAAAVLAAAVLCAPASAAAQAVAGSHIVNVATATWTIDGSEHSTQSNSAETLIDERLDTGVAAAAAVLAVSADSDQVLSFHVTNGGNGREAFELAATVTGSIALTDIRLVIDVNGDGQYEPAIDLAYAPDAPFVLYPGQTATVFILCRTPETAAAGETAQVGLIATAVTGSGNPGSVFDGQGDEGGDAVVGLNNKIRVIQRRAYGLRDEEYLRLKILTCMLPEL